MAESEKKSEKVPETNNVVLFRTAVTNCFKSIAESVSEEEFTNTMTVLKTNPQVASKAHKVMVKQLYESMCGDLDDILAEGTLTNGLAKVSKLIHEASDRPNKNAWRPPGDVDEHMRNLDAAKMKEESDKLEKQVEEMEAANERMMKEIAERRAKVHIIEERVNRGIKTLPSLIPKLESTVKQLHDLADCVEATHLN